MSSTIRTGIKQGVGKVPTNESKPLMQFLQTTRSAIVELQSVSFLAQFDKRQRARLLKAFRYIAQSKQTFKELISDTEKLREELDKEKEKVAILENRYDQTSLKIFSLENAVANLQNEANNEQ